MVGMTFLAFAIIALGFLAILSAVATHDSALLPATVNPFAPRTTDVADTFASASPSADTLDGDWRSNEVRSLREAEAMLDWLENHNVRHKELTSFGGKFQVRWR